MAAIAQLGERQTEDLKVPGSIPGGGSKKQACLCGVMVNASLSGREDCGFESRQR